MVSCVVSAQYKNYLFIVSEKMHLEMYVHILETQIFFLWWLLGGKNVFFFKQNDAM